MIEFTNRSFGANLIASDINLEIGGNLLLKSRQNLSESDSYNIGMSLGISSNSSGVGGGSIGLNLGNGYSNRAWVDQISSIIGTNSVTINTANNTNIVGALIANIKTPSPLEGEGWGEGSYDGGNLTINTGSLTYSDLKNFSVSESSQLGLNLSIGFKADEPTAPQNSESAQKNKGVIPGNLKLDLALNSQESSSDSKATIGLGNITVGGILNDETKLANLNRDINNSEQNKNTVITSDFESSLTLDTRLIAAAFYSASGAITGDEKDSQNAVNNLGSYWGDVENGVKETAKDLRFIGNASKTIRGISEDNLGLAGTVLTSPLQFPEGAIFTFLEENGAGGSQLMIVGPDGELVPVLSAKLTKDYAVNGINTNENTAFNNYLKDENSDVTLRHNPTHGFFGDLVESGLGKVADWTGQEDLIAMNRYVAQDLYDRKDMSNSTNIFHSQGSIIGKGAMELYQKEYMTPTLTYNSPSANNSDWASVGGTQTLSYANQINQTQRFVAVGPAVLEGDWYDATILLGKGIRNNADWKHDPQDPVLRLAAPSNLITDLASVFTSKPVNSPIYVPNLITNIPQGIWDGVLHMDKHDVKNPIYSEFITGSQGQNSQNLSSTPSKN